MRAIPCQVSLVLALLGWSAIASAERPPETRQANAVRTASHHHAAGDAAPASPDIQALIRSGWVQIVRFESPIGATVEVASNSGAIAIEVPGQVGLALGQPYRLRVSNIPDRPGITLYPSIRLLGYLVPPAHVDPAEYPIPIHFLDRDLDDVSGSRLVTNVVYLEDPLMALPISYPPGEMPVVDVRPGEDPLLRASNLGRPIALIQMGNRVPLDDQLESRADDPVIYMVPAPSYRSGNTSDPMVQQSGFSPGMTAASGMPHPMGCCSSPMCSSCMSITRAPYKVHPRMPFDECLPDGGDAIPYVHFNADLQVAGLGASETVAQFTRPGERPRIVPSNVVCLYSPRFGLARSSLVCVAGLYSEGTRNVDHRARRALFETREAAELRSKKDRTRLVRRREVPSIVAMNEPPAAMDELRIVAAVVRNDPYEKLTGHTGPNTLIQADEARIAMSIEAAKAWTRHQFPAYTAISESGAQITGVGQTGEIQQIKEPNLRPGELVLRKSVNPTSAKPGDVVEFVIEYFNVGQRPIESVSIVDSLTPRLEYVPNSAKTDRRGVFTAAPNDVESQELRWDISDPIPGGQKGVVWFEAKVR
jgi:uncharacterized repeat protein (TIGR01451 family)